MADHSLPQPAHPAQHNFAPDGWPINPATGQTYTRNEIITNPAIPYPQDINPNSPYWRRRTPAQLAAEQAQITKKQQQRARRRSSGSRRKTMHSAAAALSGAELQERQRAAATVELVGRANETESRTILVNLPAGMKLVA